MFNFFRTQKSWRDLVQRQAATILRYESETNREAYLLGAYRKQIAQTGKAAARHKRRARNYLTKLKAQEVRLKGLDVTLSLLDKYDSDWAFRGLINGMNPVEATEAAIERAFKLARFTVATYGGTMVEPSEEDSKNYILGGVQAGRIAQVWHGDARTGKWDDLPPGVVPEFSCPVHFYRLRPEPEPEEPQYEAKPAYDEAVARERTPLDATAAAFGGTVVVMDTAPVPEADSPAWGGSGGSSGGAGAEASYADSGSDAGGGDSGGGGD